MGNIVRNGIDYLSYQPGDTYKITSDYMSPGYITASSRYLRFTINVPKSLENISSISAGTIYCGIRHGAGGYILNDGSMLSSLGTISFYKVSDFAFNVQIILDTATSMGNNYPCICTFTSATFTFS